VAARRERAQDWNAMAEPTASTAHAAADKFDAKRAAEYDRQSRIALAGYEAMHELTACCLAAALGTGTEKSLLIVGVGTGQEIATIGRHQPHWRFTAIDPSAAMIRFAETRLADLGLLHDRTTLRACHVSELPDAAYDGATLIGVLHHIHGDGAKADLLREIAARLKPGAPFVLGGNYRAYDSESLLLAAWQERWRLYGATGAELAEKFGRITQDVDPPASEEAVIDLLRDAGFSEVRRFFSSLFWGSWIARKS
jgi:tRNA (cmo5U34)-methyltransferase